MSTVKNKINFFENLLDKNKSESFKNKITTNNNNDVKKKITHWNKIRKKVLTESDIKCNDLLNKTIYSNHNEDNEDNLHQENSIIN